MRVPFEKEESKIIRQVIEDWYKKTKNISEERFIVLKEKYKIKIDYEKIFKLNRCNGPFGAINYFRFKETGREAFTVSSEESGYRVYYHWRNK